MEDIVDTDIILIVSRIKRKCRKDAQKNNFTRTDKTIANLTKIFISSKDPQIQEIFKLILEMVINYKAKVIESRHKLQMEAVKWMSGDISDDSLRQTRDMINSLLSI